MGWLARKLDSIVGAVFAAVGGTSFSQLQAFMHQYLQRLGGHFDEAQRHLTEVSQGDRYQGLGGPARQSLIEAAQRRVTDIQAAYDALRGADPLVKPFAFARHIDPDLALRVLPDFQPSIPIDTASLVYAGAGFVLGLLAYEILKLPFSLAMSPASHR